MKYALIVAGFLASTAASATNINSPASQSNAGASSTAGASAAAGAVSGSRSSVNNSVKTNVSNRQSQTQQTQSNSQVTVAGDRNVSAPGLGGFASGPCTGIGGQVSMGVAGFGGGAGFTALDAECTRRETARILHSLGQTEVAVRLMMASPVVRELTEERADTSDYCRRNPTDYYCKK